MNGGEEEVGKKARPFDLPRNPYETLIAQPQLW